MDTVRLTRKGVFMAWRMSQGENDPNGAPVGEFAAAFNAAHPGRLE